MSGKIVTEGDRVLKADTARNKFKVDGNGVKIGIIASSFNAKDPSNSDVANGELPGANNPNGKSKPTQILKDLKPGNPIADDEGRALAQIVHDVSPGADLLFHTSVNDAGLVDDRSYADAVNSLVKAGANVIVEDAIVPTTIFEDGEAAQAAKKAVDSGVPVISAAGNNGKTSYESDYRSDGTTFKFGGKTFEAFDFDPGKKVDLFQDITVTKDQTGLAPLLTWSNPNGKVSSDLEMFLVSSPTLPSDNANNVLAVSGIPSNTAIDDPLRRLIYPTAKDRKLSLVIGRELNGTKAPSKIKWISNANGLDRTTTYEYINSNPNETGSSTISGPANLKETIAVGAADVNQDFTSGQATARNYSSEGSAPILFNDAGDPLVNPLGTIKSDLIAPGGVATSDNTGDSLLNPKGRIKPDLIAPDEISTSVAGLEKFKGTSAAAPEIAGIVALMEQAAGGPNVLRPQEIKEILQNTSIPVNLASGMSNPVPGVGLPQADLAVAQAQAISGNIMGVSNFM
jgi:Subtilase family